ncbi:SDR family NAD(P)-dependent oxidoreductase [Pseudonocardia spinosispora]|uniref:SDR family NAD(P)-dependent oxidoreductase n=1 Tax=Pseudonocardia spinosispora TaxID=103441 RepID=UPI0003FD411B|nr:SDR family NAD(P)-dependent oxidoreductase [Pseudonocardia spinosispora]
MRERWRRALVTGASGGIGEAIAARLAADGVDLVLVARRGEVLDRLAGSLSERHGVRAEVLVADLADPVQRAMVEARLLSVDDPVDLLVSCAGGAIAGPLIAQSARRRVEEVELNCVSVLALNHAAASAMVPRGRGTIVNVASGLGWYACPGGATYSASKAFVHNAGAALRYELRGTGVGVTVVSPGPVDTEAGAGAGLTMSKVPRFVFASPDQVALAALNAASTNKAFEQVNLWSRLFTSARILPNTVTQPLLAAILRRLTA